MTIQEAIQKAVEGGYQVSLKRLPCFCHNDPMCIDAPKPYDEYKTLLDPLFWQAVGKSFGWGNEYGIDERDFWVGEINYPEVIKGKAFREIWRYNWHRLIDHLASGKSIEDYFKNL